MASVVNLSFCERKMYREYTSYFVPLYVNHLSQNNTCTITTFLKNYRNTGGVRRAGSWSKNERGRRRRNRLERPLPTILTHEY